MLLQLLKKLYKQEEEKNLSLAKLLNEKVKGSSIPLKEMVKKGHLESIIIADKNEFKDIKKELNRYGVKFSVMKDKESGDYFVFFQAKDTAVIEKAFEKLTKKFDKHKDERESTLDKIIHFKEKVKDEFMPKENIQNEKNLKEIVGNIAGDIKVSKRESEKGSFTFKVANFSIVTKDNDGNKHYDNISAYGKLADEAEKLEKGDFIKLEGEQKASIGKEGKEYTSIKASHIKILKAREQMKGSKEEKSSTLGMIKELKEKAKTEEVKDKVEKAKDVEL